MNPLRAIGSGLWRPGKRMERQERMVEGLWTDEIESRHFLV